MPRHAIASRRVASLQKLAPALLPQCSRDAMVARQGLQGRCSSVLVLDSVIVAPVVAAPSIVLDGCSTLCLMAAQLSALSSFFLKKKGHVWLDVKSQLHKKTNIRMEY